MHLVHMLTSLSGLVGRSQAGGCNQNCSTWTKLACLCQLVSTGGIPTPQHSALLCPRCHQARSSWMKVSSDISMGEGENKNHSGKFSVKDCRCGTLPMVREQAVSPCCGMGEGIPRLAFCRESLKRSCWQGLARPSAGSSLCRG